MNPRPTRTQRLAMPLARSVVRQIAAEHGACLQPVQLRRTDTATGQVEQVLVPCGHTLASVCPPCAERAKALRKAQCREGWHLDREPVADTSDPDEYQRWLIETRAETQAKRDHAAADRDDTTELDALNGELDEEITRTGMRGNVLPARPARRHRSTRRRQDTPDLPRRAVAARTVGKTYTAPDGTTFRPSMFLTLTCPSYGRVGSDGTPADPATTTTGGPPATHCTSRRCSTGSCRTFAGSSATTCSTSPPSNPSGGWHRTSTSRCAAPVSHRAAPGPRRHLSPGLVARHHTRPLHRRRPAGMARGQRQLPRPRYRGDPSHLGPGPRRDRPDDQPQHVARFGERFDAQGVLAGSRDANRCIGYLTKYLTKHVADCHDPGTDAQRAHTDRLADALRYEPCSPTCANWLRYGVRPPTPMRACGQGIAPAKPTAANISATPDAASWYRANGRARRWPTTAPTAKPGSCKPSGSRHRRPVPLHLGTGHPGDPTTCHPPSGSARRRRTAALARRARPSQSKSQRPGDPGSFGNGEGSMTNHASADRLLTVEGGGRPDEHMVGFIRRLIAERRIEFVKVGRHVRISRRLSPSSSNQAGSSQ